MLIELAMLILDKCANEVQNAEIMSNILYWEFLRSSFIFPQKDQKQGILSQISICFPFNLNLVLVKTTEILRRCFFLTEDQTTQGMWCQFLKSSHESQVLWFYLDYI